jgi:hypothetical protein
VESESADDAGSRGAALIFISDASAEAERLLSTLLSRGYAVTDVPLALLSGRVAVQRPDLLICDADADGSAEILARIAEGERLAPIPVVLLGDRNGAIARLGSDRVAAAFARPVNVQELLGTVERLVGAGEVTGPGSMPPSTRGTKLAMSSRPPSRASGSIAPRPPGERREGTAAAAAPLPLPPDLEGEGVPAAPMGVPAAPRDGGDAPTVELSRDIVQILTDAEARLRDGPPAPPSGRDEHGPEVDTDGTLSPDVLAALEQPLDEEDLPGDGTPHPEGTGALTGSKAQVRGHTQIGGPTQHFTAPGGEMTGAMLDPGAPVAVITGIAAATAAGVASGFATGAATGVATGTTGAATGVATNANEPEDDRIARQQASTPRPPKPGAEDVMTGSSVEPPARVTAPPPITVTDHPIPDPPVSVGTSLLAAPISLIGAPTDPPGPIRSSPPRPRVILNFDSEPPERREPGSTTPPMRRPDEGRTMPPREDETPPPVEAAPLPRTVETDRPSPARGEQPRRRSERPAARRDSDRPGQRTEPPARRESDHPGAGTNSGAVVAPAFPTALRAGEAIALLAKAIGARYSGTLAIEVDEGIRRVVFRDGDFVTVTSGVHGESLVAFLVGRGDLPAEVARQAHKLPAFGRRAGAALIANGHLAQDALWPVLRGHAEWLIGRILGVDRATVHPEDASRLQDEPAVFGGATGAEILVEVARRVVPADEAVERLGGPSGQLAAGPARALLAECALPPLEAERVQTAEAKSVSELLETAQDPSFAAVLLALVSLEVLRVQAPRAAPAAVLPKVVHDEIDEAALRTRILTRKALVDDGDYFAVLGVPRDATGYDIRRAYTALRRELEPARVITAGTVDLSHVVDEIVGVLEEAYQILSDQKRRDRYRRAIEASP